MLQDTPAFSGFSVNDLAVAEKFYGETLGIKVENNGMGLQLHTTGNNPIFIYEKANHKPADYTMLNFEVTDIDEAAEALIQAGVELLKYDFAHQDEKGIARGRSANMGPDIAWFSDPAGNVIAILQS